MNRAAVLAGIGLLLLGSAVFFWKVFVLDTPVRPSRVDNVWRVDLEILVRGENRRGSVSAHLPDPDLRQILGDERFASEGLPPSIRSERGERVAVWRGRFDELHRLSYGFRVELRPDAALASEHSPASPETIRESYGYAEAELPTEAQAILEILGQLETAAIDDAGARLRTLFAFVADEIETLDVASNDALLTLADREGNALGKARLLATLLRATGIPARLATGLRLEASSTSREFHWTEAWVDEGWIPLFPSEGLLGTRPSDLLALRSDGGPLVESTGVGAISYRYAVLHENLRPEELSALMLPSSPLLSRLSLYRLPVTTQAALRVLLVFPLATLLVALFRNVIGLRTFGTFMPILIALALRETGLAAGLVMVGSVILIGIAGRLALDRLHLLLVPRLCVLLCLVILVVAALSLMGLSFENRDLLTGVLFPIVIIAMLIERFSITAEEESFQQALLLLGNSAIVAVCAYPLFHSALAAHLMFGYPELVLCAAGMLIILGGYTGYRLVELVRFRALVGDPEREPA